MSKYKYKLYKINDKEIQIYDHEKIKSKLTREDEKRLLTLDMGKDILKFKGKLSRNLYHCNLDNMYNNLKTIKTKEKRFFLRYLLLIFYAGFYECKENKILLLKKYKNLIINHELFHMASSVYDKKNDILFMGFYQGDYKKKRRIGRGINEGYTTLLAKRYFNEECEQINESYKVCAYICEKLEEIIGRKKMEELYLDANLLGLIETLSQYDSEKNIVLFINSVDSIIKNWNKICNPNVSKEKREKIIQETRQVIETLKDWYRTKKHIEYKNKVITEDEYLEDTILFNKDIKQNKLLFKKGI